MPAELAARLNGQDPLEVLRSIYGMELQALERLVRSKSRALALKLKHDAAVAAMPYVHSRMPVKVEVQDERLPTLVIATGFHQMQQIQRVIDGQAVTVAREVSSHETQAIEAKGKDDA